MCTQDLQCGGDCCEILDYMQITQEVADTCKTHTETMLVGIPELIIEVTTRSSTMMRCR